MIYLIEFQNYPLGLYKRTPYGDIFTVSPGVTQILITNPDLEAYATISNEIARKDFFEVKTADVLAGLTSPEALRTTKHLVLIQGWELSALLKKVHSDCFELSFGGGERIWTTAFGMGEPVE